jgi:hypothetical protein
MKAIARKLTFINPIPKFSIKQDKKLFYTIPKFSIKQDKKLFYNLESIFIKKLGEQTVSRINVQLADELLYNENR